MKQLKSLSEFSWRPNLPYSFFLPSSRVKTDVTVDNDYYYIVFAHLRINNVRNG